MHSAHIESKRLLAIVAAGAIFGFSASGRAQAYDADNSFVYLSSNLPDASNSGESSGTQSALVPMAINDSGTIAGYYRAYQWTGQYFGHGYPTGVVLTTSSNYATPNTTVTSLSQIVGASDPTADPSSLPSSSGYGSGSGNDNVGTGINNAGAIAETNNVSQGEWASIAAPSANPGIYASSVFITAQSAAAGSNGTFGGGNFAGSAAPSGLGTAINNAGDVVGGAFAYAASANSKDMHALIAPASGGDPIDLNSYVPGAFASMVYGVDPNTSMEAGNAILVGVSTPYTATASTTAGKVEKSATIWTYNGTTWTTQLLPSLYTLHPNSTSEGQSVAYGAANVGGTEEVVGVSDGPTGYPVATLWINGVPTNLDGTNNGTHETMTAPYVNAFENTNPAADPDIKDYFPNTNDIQSVADAINTSGDIVGYTTIIPGAVDDSGKTAVLWNSSGGEINLNAYVPASLLAEYPGAYLEEATAINDQGQIVGYGVDTAGTTFGFELNPIANTTVPEPSGLALAGLSLGLVSGLLGRRRRSAMLAG
jgi:hypothetical protein